MLIDTNELASGSVIQTQICIVGGGAAGISMALELEKAGIDTVVLESGGLSRDEATADLYRGPSVGIPYDFSDGTRSRFLGGSSNCWGGFCRPWDQSAFEHRSWVNASGWPIGRADLEPFYQRSHAILQVPSNDYDPAHWVGNTGEATHGPSKGLSAKAASYPFDPKKVEEIISQYSPPLKMGEAYRSELKAAKHVKVYIKANVVELQCNPWGGAVESAKIRTLKGVSATVQAKVFVLASGGIENARLLVIAIDNREQALSIAHFAREVNPNIDIVARAYDRLHTFDLYQAGANEIVRETFDAAIRAGKRALERLGMSRDDAEKVGKIFYRHDRHGMIEQARVYDPTLGPFNNKQMAELVVAQRESTREAVQAALRGEEEEWPHGDD